MLNVNNSDEDMIYENTPEYRQELTKKYKHLITPKIRNNEEILSILKERYKLIAASKKDVGEIFWELCILGNITQICPIEEKDMIFQIVKVEKCWKNRKLYRITKKDGYKGEILLVFEEKSQYFDSKSNPLAVECLVLRGISPDDYEKETNEFWAYLMTLSHCEELFGKNQTEHLLNLIN